jgi:hypothetical protein
MDSMDNLTVADAKPRRSYRTGAVRKAPSALCRIDRRTAESRRYEFLVRELGKGLDSSQATRIAVEAAALSTLRTEMLAAKVIAGETVPEAELTRSTNAQSRALRQLQALKNPKGRRGRTLDEIMQEMKEREAGL